MKLFGFNKKHGNTFQITEPDRLWVEHNFRWLIQVFGYPDRASEQILLTENYFPTTFKADKVLIENIIKDVCALFQIQEDKLTFEVSSDIRDTYGIPFAIEGKQFETELEVEGGKYKIHIANNLQNYPKRLIYSVVYEFIRIKLSEHKLNFDGGDDTDLFIYLAGIYLGYGVLLSQNLYDTGRVDDGFWETKWNYYSDMPNEVMAFGLALFAKLTEQDAPEWKEHLPLDLKIQFEKAKNFLTDNPSELYDKNELEANELFNAADKLYLRNEFETAISMMQKVLTLTKDDRMKADVYNNLGYYTSRLRKYEQSVTYLEKAIQLIPDDAYANDNLGYALIQLGKLEEGKEYLKKALETEDNDVAYTFRNFALYYQAKGEMDEAEDFFKKSFESVSDPVDLLEYHYADFLIQCGKTDKGMEYLKKALEKGEPEAIQKMNEIKKN